MKTKKYFQSLLLFGVLISLCSCKTTKIKEKSDINIAHRTEHVSRTATHTDTSAVQFCQKTAELATENFTIAEKFDENGTIRERLTTGTRKTNKTAATAAEIKHSKQTDSHLDIKKDSTAIIDKSSTEKQETDRRGYRSLLWFAGICVVVLIVLPLIFRRK